MAECSAALARRLTDVASPRGAEIEPKGFIDALTTVRRRRQWTAAVVEQRRAQWRVAVGALADLLTKSS